MQRSRSLRLIVVASMLSGILGTGAAAAGASDFGPAPNAPTNLLASRGDVGLDPRFDFESVMAMRSPTGTLCLYLMPAAPWLGGMPPGHFSWFVQVMALLGWMVPVLLLPVLRVLGSYARVLAGPVAEEGNGRRTNGNAALDGLHARHLLHTGVLPVKKS